MRNMYQLYKGNALHCNCYNSERKPKYVLFPKKECPAYHNNSPMNLKIQSDKENKIYGGLVGFCVGNALGVQLSFQRGKKEKRTRLKKFKHNIRY